MGSTYEPYGRPGTYDKKRAIKGSIIIFHGVECYVRNERNNMFELVLVNNDDVQHLSIDEDSFDQ